MFNEGVDLSAEIAQGLLTSANHTITIDDKEHLVKDMAHELADKLVTLAQDYPASVVMLALGAVVGSASIRLTENAEGFVANPPPELQEHLNDGDAITVPHPDTHALAAFFLARRYIASVAKAREAIEETKEHIDNGRKLS